MRPEYIFMDLDGTISDPKEGITKAVAHALSYYGIQVENLDTLEKFIGPPLLDSFQYILYRSLSILKLSNIFIFLQEVH